MNDLVSRWILDDRLRNEQFEKPKVTMKNHYYLNMNSELYLI
jgi:hypothetical protein